MGEFIRRMGSGRGEREFTKTKQNNEISWQKVLEKILALHLETAWSHKTFESNMHL